MLSLPSVGGGTEYVSTAVQQKCFCCVSTDREFCRAITDFSAQIYFL